MTPREQAEIEAVARDLDKFGLKRNAARLRALVGEQPDDERPCPVQDESHHVRAIPWGLAEILYPAYGHSQSLEGMAERGGFGRGEIGRRTHPRQAGERAYRSRGRLERWPLLDLYDMAVRNG